ncbi:MAG: hypothetical protein ACN0LA_12350 [Candidatus Longimicrobiales bacterium M2_2A_002]
MRQATLKTTVVALAVAALAAGCEDRNAAEQGRPEEPAAEEAATAEQPATEEAAAQQPATQEPSADAARVALPGLFAIMLDLQGDMQQVSRGLWTEAYDTIAAGARAIADHPKVPPEEAATIAEALGPDMARFKALDTRVHDLSVELAEAARAGDMETVLARDAAIRQGCVECHTAFRERLRSDLP